MRSSAACSTTSAASRFSPQKSQWIRAAGGRAAAGHRRPRPPGDRFVPPRARRLQHRPMDLPGPGGEGHERARDPGDRQPQRGHARRLDPSRALEVIAAVRPAVRVPLAVKVGPFFTAMANMATRMVEAGADGLVLFNRFYQPDLDLETMRVVPRVALSTPEELRLPLRWTAILRGRTEASLAVSGGVHSGRDAAKALAAGADVAMTTSALLRNGPEHLAAMERQLVACLTQREVAGVQDLRGSLREAAAPDPAALERANYMRTLMSWPAAARSR